MRKNRFLMLILFVSSFMVTGTLFSKDEIITIEKTGHRKPPIKFNHQAHIDGYGTKCIDCHHSGDNKKCNTCHMKKDQSEVLKLKDVFHEQCRNCHRKKNGPLACSRCHKQS